jgi:hypothetical protein
MLGTKSAMRSLRTEPRSIGTSGRLTSKLIFVNRLSLTLLRICSAPEPLGPIGTLPASRRIPRLRIAISPDRTVPRSTPRFSEDTGHDTPHLLVRALLHCVKVRWATRSRRSMLNLRKRAGLISNAEVSLHSQNMDLSAVDSTLIHPGEDSYSSGTAWGSLRQSCTEAWIKRSSCASPSAFTTSRAHAHLSSRLLRTQR